MAATITITGEIGTTPFAVTTVVSAAAAASVTTTAATSTSSHPSVNRIVTSTLDLSAIYSPFSTCASYIFTLPPIGYDEIYYGTNTLHQSVTGIDRARYRRCLPQDFIEMPKLGANTTTTLYTNSAGTSIGIVFESFYSPGICPVSYTPVAQRVSGSTTFETCCLPGRDLTYFNTGLCVDYMPYSATVINGSSTGLINIDYVAADPITVAYQSSDLTLWYDDVSNSPSSVSSLLSSAGGAKPSASTIPSSNSLSTGAEIGIGVGVGVGALLLILAAVWFFLRRRRQQQQRWNTAGQIPQHGTPEYPGPVYSTPVSPYTDDKQAGQAAQGHRLSELDGYKAPAELGSLGQGAGPYEGKDESNERQELA